MPSLKLLAVLALTAFTNVYAVPATPDVPAVTPEPIASEAATQEAGEGTQSPIIKALLKEDEKKETKITNK
ncbi:hypothetical protein [Pseudomonas amygdali]|uniref:hypothetical protein n=1 Tax=Pseudomonas amygdali TaxID=47877 RepID=UPI0010721776|nr:hypothetical protein [Pseudomonas amygdali]